MIRHLTALLGLVAGVCAVAWLTALPLVGQSRAAAGASPKAARWTPAKTSWGDPDLQGIWSYASITPLERPSAQAGREFLTTEEADALNNDAAVRADRREKDPRADVEAAYNAFWWDRGKSTGRTSLIVDPADGRLPPLTAEGERRRAEAAAFRRAHPADSYEDRPLQERCITYHGIPPLPTGYNNNYQIVQTPGYVTILDENIHDARVIPLDGRAHLPSSIRHWNGDSRGRWDGTTLVVETTNYSPKTAFRFPVAPETLRAVERFTRVAADQIDYRYTINDPTTYTRPWTVALPMTAIDGPIYEYACHEGNYGLAHVLAGARAEDKAAGGSSRDQR
jgi:hypothetical protein